MATIALPQRSSDDAARAWEKLKARRRQLAARVLQWRVPQRNFSIISNDCWGGMAYEELAIQYQSPFVGLFVVPEDYVRMLRNFRTTVKTALGFQATSRHEYLNEWRGRIGRFYPIGVLPGDVEIHFLHYNDPATAKTKWERRTSRINWDNLRFKLSWHEYTGSMEALRAFAELDLPSKLMLAPPRISVQGAVALPDFSTDGTQQYWRSHRRFDVAAYLREGRICRSLCSRLLGPLFYWHY